MAFQAGSRIDPRLLDYSGYARGMTQAAAINAQALASLGQAVGEGIDKYNEKQLQKKQKKEATPVIASFLRQIDPSLSEEQSNAGANSFINSVGIEGVQAAIPVLTVEAMKSQNKIRLAQLEAFGELGKQETLSVTDQLKALEEFKKNGIYYNQGFRIEGGQLFREVDPTPGKLGPGFKSDVQLVPVTEGPVYNVAVQSGALAQTPTIDTSMVGQPPIGTGTVLRESGSPNTLGLDGMPEAETPTLGQIEDITTKVDYGDFKVTNPKIIEQDVGPSLTATNRPKTYEEFRKSTRKASDATPEKYQKYLDNFKYKYPKTYEEYSAPMGKSYIAEEAYVDKYLPRFY